MRGIHKSGSLSYTSDVIPLPARKKRETGHSGGSRAGERGARGFVPTDLVFCLFHKTPFLGGHAGTGESGSDRLKELDTLAWDESASPFLSLCSHQGTGQRLSHGARHTYCFPFRFLAGQ